MSPHIQTLISLIETLPLNIQKQIVEHLQEYIQQFTKNLDPQQKIIPTDDYSSKLSPEELEMLNNCTEIPVWSPFDSLQ
ncbi:MAG: hypothetical protein HEQ20_12195 [Aphanizomenon flos-aquae KM1D3_PB]|jgi:hypothetical protein|uniref:hypothetical protein n=1 Tax=Aphanizomenon flos-aquae TaxID=1176 RepID=UPI000542BE11|nr:hypothetical protein [Aphanizomenon flos-aquae]KHG41005.1 hypothetical protein OA07_13975 [Aphanizomenon flos-aquae 2012/KM1/D3]QSV71378.1 MAG: hypothetical protein HEQ20_12195 [Aphanizomenon flos-aquae KM1D3_PB]